MLLEYTLQTEHEILSLEKTVLLVVKEEETGKSGQICHEFRAPDERPRKIKRFGLLKKGQTKGTQVSY